MPCSCELSHVAYERTTEHVGLERFNLSGVIKIVVYYGLREMVYCILR